MLHVLHIDDLDDPVIRVHLRSGLINVQEELLS